MELRPLRYFVAVAEELHFGHAARRLHMAQPPLSRQIMNLEDELGVRLFERTRRHVALTGAGRVLLADARHLLAQADEAVLSVRRAARGESGRLAVGFVGSATYGVLPGVLRAFRRKFPKVDLVLLEMGSGSQAQAVVEGRLNLGLVRPAPADAELSRAGLASLIVQREPVAVALPAGHPLARLGSVPLARLAGEPFVVFPRDPRPGYADFVLTLCAKAGFTPTVAQETQEVQTAVSLVSAGIGVAIVPDSVRTLRRAGVVYKPIATPAPITELAALYQKGDHAPVLRAFLEILKGVSRDRPEGD